jgi:hypothetical protein
MTDSGNAPAPSPGARSGTEAKSEADEKKAPKRPSRFRAAMRIKTASKTKNMNEEADVKYFEPAGVNGRKKGDVVSGLSTEEMRRLWRSGALVQDNSPEEDDEDEPDFGSEDATTSPEKSSTAGARSSDASPNSGGTATPTK